MAIRNVGASEKWMGLVTCCGLGQTALKSCRLWGRSLQQSRRWGTSQLFNMAILMKKRKVLSIVKNSSWGRARASWRRPRAWLVWTPLISAVQCSFPLGDLCSYWRQTGWDPPKGVGLSHCSSYHQIANIDSHVLLTGSSSWFPLSFRSLPNWRAGRILL